MSTISYDPRSFLIDGRRLLVMSAEIHYARMPRALWGQVLDASVAQGINTIACYVFWSWHEPSRSVYDFSGDRDLGHFLELCAERGLHVILRAGPYCCAEWNYGGYPAYLRDEPGIRIRTLNAAYTRRVEKFFQKLIPEVLPFLATKGGPIITVQVENEYANVAQRYGEEGQRYLVWIANLALSLGIDVPLIMCEGGTGDVIETLNGFSLPRERIAEFRAKRPDLPMIWTELWPAWYDTWGFGQHRREPENIAFHLLDYVTNGGSGWNYYMWYGGTNFGRTAMYLQTTSYGFDAPIDEFGRTRPVGHYLGTLHRLLQGQTDLITGGTLTHKDVGDHCRESTWKLGRRRLVITADHARRHATVSDGVGSVLFDTSADYAATARAHPAKPWRTAQTLDAWRVWTEPFPADRPDAVSSSEPVEQLLLTHDSSDYCWYATKLNVKRAGTHTLTLPYAADVLRVFLDGKLVGITQPPFLENRGPTVPLGPDVPSANALESRVGCYEQTFTFHAKPGPHRLEILAASLGLSKGDWMLSASMETEKRGIWATPLFDGAPLRDWDMHPGLVGERLRIASEGASVTWRPAPKRARPCTWHETTFRIPAKDLGGRADFRLDAAGLDKGHLFINGHALGRHWLLTADGYGADEFWHGVELNGMQAIGQGEPTQRYYHIPWSWLQQENRMVVFEEGAVHPAGITLQRRRE